MNDPKKPSNLTGEAAEPESPSTFHLAALSAILSLNHLLPLQPDESVHNAMTLWRTAQRAKHSESNLNILLDGIFTMGPGEWQEQIEKWCGPPTYLQALMSGRTDPPRIYHFDDEVLPKLFPAQGYSTKKRLELFDKLLATAVKSEVFNLWKDEFAKRPWKATEFNYTFVEPVTVRTAGAPPDPARMPTAADFKGKYLYINGVRLLVLVRWAMNPPRKKQPKGGTSADKP